LELVPKRYFRFGYDERHSKIARHCHKSNLALIADDKEKIWKRANEVAYRRQTQPQGIFSAGCTFKNISKCPQDYWLIKLDSRTCHW
jgi:UDP-N-acetylenolpyruvoylglucosamine reductase